MTTHIVIPDVQLKPGVPTEHLEWISKFIIAKKPDVLVIIGDWADMPSLSSYDKGKKSFEGRTYKADILAANDGLQKLMAPIEAEQERLLRGKRGAWKLRKIVTLGNHENRINRMIELHRELEGTYSTDDIFFKQWGFEVYPFLQPVTVDGVCYCHYFISGQKGQPTSSARALIINHHMSCFAGHNQVKDIAYAKRPDGSRLTCIIAGAAYLHHEDYLGAQGNNHWRGIFRLHEVNNGSFDEMPVSLDFLRERYGK